MYDRQIDVDDEHVLIRFIPYTKSRPYLDRLVQDNINNPDLDFAERVHARSPADGEADVDSGSVRCFSKAHRTLDSMQRKETYHQSSSSIVIVTE